MIPAPSFQTFSSRGQATVEIMIILPLLLILLAISISIFSQQLLIADSIRSQEAVERSALLLANGVMEISLAPAGSSMRIFIPSGPEAQTIIVSNGLVEARSSRGYASVRIPLEGWSSPSLNDGNFFLFLRDSNGTISVEAI